MSNVVAIPVPEGVEMSAKHLANSQEIKPSYAGTISMFILTFFIPAVPISVLICFLAGLFAPAFTFLNAGGVFVIFDIMFIPVAVSIAIETAESAMMMAEDSLEAKSKKWLSEQGHQMSYEAEAELNRYGKIVIRDAVSGAKIKIEQEETYLGNRMLSYAVLKKPKAKAALSERKSIQLFQPFAPSAVELIDNIQRQGKQLLALPLSIENKHAVERVLSDVEELNKLGSMVQGFEPTKLQMRTLKMLNKEMKTLALNVNNSMMKQLKIHASYIEERNRQKATIL